MLPCRQKPEASGPPQGLTPTQIQWLVKTILAEGMDFTDLEDGPWSSCLTQLSEMSQASPLMLAAMYGQFESFELLVEVNKLSVGQTNSRGLTALMLAILCGQLDIVQYVVHLGTHDSAIRSRTLLDDRSMFGHSMLHMAVLSGEPEMVQILIDAGSKVNDVNLRGSSSSHLAVLLPQPTARAMIQVASYLVLQSSTATLWNDCLLCACGRNRLMD